MELQNFDQILERVPKMARPMRVILAGSDGENMLKGIFAAQDKGLVQPVLVGDRARTMTVLEQLGLDKDPYTMVDTPPGHNVTQAAIDIINSGDGDVLMRGNMPTRDFLMPVLDGKNGLRTDRLMSHVSLASLPEYPKLLALSDMTVIINPNLTQKKASSGTPPDALKAFGYETPSCPAGPGGERDLPHARHHRGPAPWWPDARSSGLCRLRAVGPHRLRSDPEQGGRPAEGL